MHKDGTTVVEGHVCDTTGSVFLAVRVVIGLAHDALEVGVGEVGETARKTDGITSINTFIVTNGDDRLRLSLGILVQGHIQGDAWFYKTDLEPFCAVIYRHDSSVHD